MADNEGFNRRRQSRYKVVLYKFIQLSCKQFHEHGVKNKQYSPEMFPRSRTCYTCHACGDRNLCAISMLAFVSKRPVSVESVGLKQTKQVIPAFTKGKSHFHPVEKKPEGQQVFKSM